MKSFTLISLCLISTAHCHKCDQAAFERVKKSGTLEIYQCDLLWYEACVPLYCYGTLVGFLMMGQTTIQDNKEKIKERALVLLKDHLDALVQSIPIHPYQEIESFAHIFELCARSLSLENKLEPKNRSLAYQIKKYVETHYNQSLTLASLSQTFKVSKSTLEYCFKEAYQCTLHSYITKYRIQQACLLLKSDLSIQEISFQVGFQDANYFTKVFKKQMKCSPSQFRKQEYEKTI